LELALRFKLGTEGEDLPLRGKTLGMIFRKHSTRTRISFEVGMLQLGGHALFLSASDTHLGRGAHGESLADTARVLSLYLDAVMLRTFEQSEVEELAEYASVPVINGLTDRVHPCQLIADLLTLREEFGSDLSALRVAWVGDGNNMANSWINAAGLLGFELCLAVPVGYDPNPEILAAAQATSQVTLVRDPREAVRGAHAVCTDTWTSMGQEDDSADRLRVFAPYQVSEQLMAEASPEAVFLHCLPAHRGEEVTTEVMDGRRSRVFEEAENRLHAQKALLLNVMG
jgi:ornithine carbamoyltransferase